jgi:hypothetical protein
MSPAEHTDRKFIGFRRWPSISRGNARSNFQLPSQIAREPEPFNTNRRSSMRRFNADQRSASRHWQSAAAPAALKSP